jgi:UDP-GlcNAc:undecaprenyl-phosphate GlcNAc-1-phosphate transferase
MSQIYSFVVPAATAAILSYALAPIASSLAIWVGAVDMPGDRKIHVTAIPRLGGLAVVISSVLVLSGIRWLSGGWWHLPWQLARPLAFGGLPIVIVSVIDDIKSVGARKKLLAHTIGAFVAVALGVSLGPVIHLFGTPIYIGNLAMPLSALWIVGVTNAFNIIDGLDGLSAGLALISAASMAAVFTLLGEPQMVLVVLILGGALIGFLPYNLYPARMFLGDSGSTAIGFCLAVLALKGGSTLSAGFAALLPVFMLGLPIADTLITMARRMVARLENRPGGIFVPDRNHIHHRLLALGIHHGQAVLILYGAGLLFAIAAFVSVFMSARDAGLFVVALLMAGGLGVHRLGYNEFAFIRRGTVLKLYEMPTVKRGMFVVFIDVFLSAIAAYVAVGLKGDEWALTLVRSPVINLAATYAPVTVLFFSWSGMYRGSWRVAGLSDLTRAFVAVLMVTVAGAIVINVAPGAHYSASLFVVYGIVTMILTTALRGSYVVLETIRLRANHQGMPILIYGAGTSGVAAVRELFRNSSSGLRPIGFIDDDIRKRGRLVSSLPVFGPEREIEAIIRTNGAKAVLIAAQKVPEERLERTIAACKRAGAGMYRFNVNVEVVSGGTVGLDTSRVVLPIASNGRDATTAAALGDNFPNLGAEICPACASRDVYRSKARSFYERLRKLNSPKRLFRCRRCGWRGWLVLLDACESALDDRTLAVDLSHLDRRLSEAAASVR